MGCTETQYANRLCRVHYTRKMRNGHTYLVNHWMGREPHFLPLHAPDWIDSGEAIGSWSLLQDLKWALDTLNSREQQVLDCRFLRGLSLGETGRLMGGVGRERVRQIEAKALRRLRHPSRREHLRGYVENSFMPVGSETTGCMRLDAEVQS